MGEPAGADFRFWASFFRTLPALLQLLGPEVEGNQERLMISVRLSFCLSSYARGEGEEGKEVQSYPLPGSAIQSQDPPSLSTPTHALQPPRTVQRMELEQGGQPAVVLCLRHQGDGQARLGLQRLVPLLLLLQGFFLFLLGKVRWVSKPCLFHAC